MSVRIVRASAGSGKTYTLAAEYCAVVVRSPSSYRSILAVTFTNKATAEMKRRIVDELSALAEGVSSPFFDTVVSLSGVDRVLVPHRASEALSNILRDFSAFSIMTIDKFFQRIIRSFFRELGLDFSYSVQIDTASSMLRAIDSLVDRASSDPLLAQLLERLVGERLDQGKSWSIVSELRKISSEIFNDEFREAHLTTSELISRFSELKKQASQAESEIRQVAQSACEMIVSAGLSPDDFKYGRTSFAHYLFRIGGGATIEIYGKRFAEFPSKPESAYTDKSPSKDQILSIITDLTSVVAQVIEIHDRTLSLRKTVEALSVNFSNYLLLSYLKRSFHEVLKSDGEMAIAHTTSFIDEIARSASVPFIFERLGGRYSTIFIDEFQDTSSGQWRGFLPILHEAIAVRDAEVDSVMLIGDVKQAIYRWRGGDWNILDSQVEVQFEGQCDTSHVLDVSYRSEARVVEFNNSLIEWVVADAQSEVAAFLDGERTASYGELLTSVVRAYRFVKQRVAPSKLESTRGYVQLDRFDDEQLALDLMLENIRDAVVRGVQPSDMAVLVRKRAEGVRVAEFLIANGMSVVSDEVLLLRNSPTVNFVLDVFRLASSPSAVRLAAVNRYLGRELNRPLTDSECVFITSITSVSLVACFENLVRFFSLQRVEVVYLQGLYDVLYRFTTDNKAGAMSDFLSYWDEKCDRFSLVLPPDRDAVNILTIHKAKGLEWGCVFIPFASWATAPSVMPPTRLWVSSREEPYSDFNPFPINYSSLLADTVYRDAYLREGVSSIVDNVNLLYVALTRARSELYVSIPETPKRGTIALYISNSIDAMQWQGSMGEKLKVVSLKLPSDDLSTTVTLDHLPSYAQRAVLDLSE